MAMPVITTQEMRALEARLLAQGTGEALLIEMAASGVLQVMREIGADGHLLAVCGRGNNGGDGCAIARQWVVQGGEATIALVGDPQRMGEAARLHLELAVRMGARLLRIQADREPCEGFEALEACLREADLVVDALFGIGLARPVQGIYARVIEAVNNSGAPVLAVDLPSGIHAQDGRLLGTAVSARHTVTFQYPKPGHLLMPGRMHCGELHVWPIAKGLEPPLRMRTLQPKDVRDLLPRRAADAHKGDCGRVELFAGSAGMAGAGILCARSALCAGAGLVTLHADPALESVYQQAVPQAMYAPQEGDAPPPAPGGRGVAAIGPGRGNTPQTLSQTLSLCGRPDARVVVDADALNALSTLESIPKLQARCIFTPHVGEMARLTGLSSAAVLASPIDVAREFAKAHGVVVALKSATTVIAEPSGRVTFNVAGSPAMAKGGSGDLLCGCIAALWAQGLEPYAAAGLGCYLMGRAGERAALERGRYSVLAEDLLSALGDVMRDAG